MKITKTQLRQIIKEELQNLREEEEEVGHEWRVSYSFPLISGKTQPATEHVVAPNAEKAMEKAAEQVKEKVAKNPDAAGPATILRAHQN